MADREEMIEQMPKLYKVKYGRKKGVVIDYHEGQEVGIHTYNYDVLTPHGIYYGYWTDSKPDYAERTIVSRIVGSEECQDWDQLDDEAIEECFSLLQEDL